MYTKVFFFIFCQNGITNKYSIFDKNDAEQCATSAYAQRLCSELKELDPENGYTGSDFENPIDILWM